MIHLSIAEAEFSSHRSPRFDLGMKRVMKGAVKFALIRTLEHHREIFAVFPMSLRAKLSVHAFKENRSGERIGNRDADIVGTSRVRGEWFAQCLSMSLRDSRTEERNRIESPWTLKFRLRLSI